MQAIATLTMNPALDASTDVDSVTPDIKLRCSAPHYEPGGGGVNVARAIRRLGGDAVAIFPSGGDSGRLFNRLLDAEGVPSSWISIAGETRENINVREKATGRQFRFCMPGPQLVESDWQACLERLRAALPRNGFVVASGSLPPGVPRDFYARVARIVRASGNAFVLDSSGDPLRLALEEGVDLVKPSLREFHEITGAAVADESDLPRHAEKMIGEGRCRQLVISLGPGGAFWMSPEGSERLTSPAVSAVSSVGAGDSMVAGIVLSLARGRPFPEAVRYGVAAGAAAVLNPGTELCRPEDVERLAEGVAASAAAGIAVSYIG